MDTGAGQVQKENNDVLVDTFIFLTVKFRLFNKNLIFNFSSYQGIIIL